MKKLLITACICICNGLFSQNDTLDWNVETIQEVKVDTENQIPSLAFVDEQPEFPGGNEALFAFIKQNFVIPKPILEQKIKGRTYATFVIDEKGKVTDIKVLRDLGYGTDNETTRVLKKMPKWKPAKIKGKVVKCQYTIPITVDGNKS